MTYEMRSSGIYLGGPPKRTRYRLRSFLRSSALVCAAGGLAAAGVTWSGHCALEQSRAVLREAVDLDGQAVHRRESAVGALGFEVIYDVALLRAIAERDDDLGDHARAMLNQVRRALDE